MTDQIQQRTVPEILVIQAKTKAPVSYIPPPYILAIARVFEFGALKYAVDNWKAMMANGKSVQFKEAIIRHALKMVADEIYDEESGQTHAAHIGCNAAMLHWFATASSEEIRSHKDSDLLIKGGHEPKEPSKESITKAVEFHNAMRPNPFEADQMRLDNGVTLKVNDLVRGTDEAGATTEARIEAFKTDPNTFEPLVRLRYCWYPVSAFTKVSS